MIIEHHLWLTLDAHRVWRRHAVLNRGFRFFVGHQIRCSKTRSRQAAIRRVSRVRVRSSRQADSRRCASTVETPTQYRSGRVETGQNSNASAQTAHAALPTADRACAHHHWHRSSNSLRASRLERRIFDRAIRRSYFLLENPITAGTLKVDRLPSERIAHRPRRFPAVFTLQVDGDGLLTEETQRREQHATLPTGPMFLHAGLSRRHDPGGAEMEPASKLFSVHRVWRPETTR